MPNTRSHPVLGPGDAIGAGDSKIFYDAVQGLREDAFVEVRNEVYWQKMYHAQGPVPRLVCTQGSTDANGAQPVYRHPSDQSPPLLHFTPTVLAIKNQVEKIVGHRFNHALIQMYRSGEDFISEHSDKTLDIVRGSSIVNVSLGARRNMRLRTKRSALPRPSTDGQGNPRQSQLIPMPHNSVFVLGPETNAAWLHSIPHDKRPICERSDEEKAFGGERVSLTFRNIGTFLSGDSSIIWGQGACSKNESDGHAVINGNEEKAQELINAFGFENQQTTFDWDATYGCGFDVLHFRNAPPRQPFLFLSDDQVSNMKVMIHLEELGIPYELKGVSRDEINATYRPKICFRDTDPQRTELYGAFSILSYLDRTYANYDDHKPALAEVYALSE